MADNPVIFGQGGTGKIGVSGIAVLKAVPGTYGGKAAGYRIVEPHGVPDPEISLTLVAQGLHDDDGIGIQPVPAENGHSAAAVSLSGADIGNGVFCGKIVLFISNQIVNPG
jgi:hypothetical protein